MSRDHLRYVLGALAGAFLLYLLQPSDQSHLEAWAGSGVVIRPPEWFVREEPKPVTGLARVTRKTVERQLTVRAPGAAGEIIDEFTAAGRVPAGSTVTADSVNSGKEAAQAAADTSAPVRRQCLQYAGRYTENLLGTRGMLEIFAACNPDRSKEAWLYSARNPQWQVEGDRPVVSSSRFNAQWIRLGVAAALGFAAAKAF